MRIKLFLWTFFTICAMSCSVLEDDVSEVDNGYKTFYAVLEQPSSQETKVFVNEDLRLRWDDDDRIAIFDKNTYAAQHKYVGGDGESTGEFEKISTGGFVTGNSLDIVCAVYPYLSDKPKINNAGSVVTLTLPNTQTYRAGSFGLGANTMISTGEDDKLAFKNVCGYLALKLYGDNASVSSITLTGNDGEYLSGKAEVKVALGEVPSLQTFTSGTDFIKLECKNPVKVGSTADNATIFWIVVPPTKFEKGFTVTVEYNDGDEFVQTTSRSIEIKRSCLTRMAAFKVD